MDIYNLLNSRDVAEHCRGINHQFNSMETAFIVHWSNKLTLREKHTAYREIIETMPDMEIKERLNLSHYPSLHQLLKDYMDIENRIIEVFQADGDNAIYNYQYYYKEEGNKPTENDVPFSSFSSFMKVFEIDEDIFKHLIYKRWLDTEEYRESYIEVTMNSDKEPLECYSTFLEKHESKIHHAFKAMWFEIPTPFKKGDILIDANVLLYKNSHENVFVLENLVHWDERWRERNKADGDASDMIGWGYWLDSDGSVYWESAHDYQDLEYYRGELHGKARTLLAISHFIKYEISLHLLMDAYYVICNGKEGFNEQCLTKEDRQLIELLKKDR